jgi:ABC-type glycerol-3-phosphate transport system permease component
MTTIYIWFIVVSLMVLVPSFTMLINASPDSALDAIPIPPSKPEPLKISIPANLDDNQVKALGNQVSAYTQQVASYSSEVSAYTQQIVAYKLHAETAKIKMSNAYDTVVKGTLATLFTTFFTALLGYVFVRVGTGVIDNFIRYKANKPLNNNLLG